MERRRDPESGESRGQCTQCTELKAKSGDPRPGELPAPTRSGPSSPNYKTEKHLAHLLTRGSPFPTGQAQVAIAEETENRPLPAARDPPLLGDEGSAERSLRLAPTQGPAGASAAQAPLQSGLLKRAYLLHLPPQPLGKPAPTPALAPGAEDHNKHREGRGGEAHLRGKVRGGEVVGRRTSLGVLARGGAAHT